MATTGIILAGGKSLRMGRDKGLTEFKDRPMIQHVIDHIEPICDQILISANRDEYNKFGYQVVRDEIKDIGPAGGIISCLPHAKHTKCIIISCDLPYASKIFIEQLLSVSEKYEITIPRMDNYLQPLCAIYSKDILPRFKSLVDQGQYSMQKLVNRFTLNIVDQYDLSKVDFQVELRNINSLADLKHLDS
jgi:molybdopterin-guanine dinucleotide biosynthesis protein A